MNKRQLILAVKAKGGRKLSPTEAVETVLDVIVRAVASGDPVSITGFGTLVPKYRPARDARDPRTGAKLKAAPSYTVRFRPGTRFRDLVSGRKPLPDSGNCIQKDPRTPRP